MRYYRVAAINSEGTGPWTAMTQGRFPMHDEPHGPRNVDPMADVATSTATVMAGATQSVDVSSYFSDADNDTLTYSSMSDDTGVATVNATGNPVMITGVAAGTTTVKVYASDGMGGTNAMHTITVTVEPGDLMAPTGVMAVDATTDPDVLTIDVTWTNGANALSHMVLLFDTSDYSVVGMPATRQDNGMTTFTNVPAGTYIAVVVAYDADVNIRLGISNVVTPGS